ncbi:MAG: hypothetical protein H5T62_18570 [Anaerolineae bacterium]|nr:hypothetical protein [Anaerolineae bacterium]
MKNSTFWALLWYEAMMWGLACLLHYSGEGLRRNEERMDASMWLRKAFGDFRKEGTLEIRGVIVQSACYITTVIGLVAALRSELSKEVGISLAFGQLFLSGFGVVLVFDVAPRLFKRRKK